VLWRKVGSNDARTYAIIEGEEPGYSSSVMPLNRQALKEPLANEVRQEIVEIIQLENSN
jgi:hypothetical protein